MTTDAEDLRGAYLLYESADLDLAIFALSEQEDSWDRYVKLDQLVATDLGLASNFADRKVFCVGYAGPIQDNFNTYVQNHQILHKNDAKIQELYQQDEVRKFIRSQYYGLLTLLQRPTFENVFHPGERILVMGKLPSTFAQHPLPVWDHNLCGWFGISGGMIANLVPYRKDNPPVEATLLGMCKFIPFFY